MSCCSVKGDVKFPVFGMMKELPGALAKRRSSCTLISIPIPIVMIVVVAPVTARFFSKLACAYNLENNFSLINHHKLNCRING